MTQSSTGQTDSAILVIEIENDYESLDEYGWQLASTEDFEQLDDSKWQANGATLVDGTLVLTAEAQGSSYLTGLTPIRIDGDSVGRLEVGIQTADSRDPLTVLGLRPVADSYQGNNVISLIEGNADKYIAGAHYGTGLLSGVSFNEDSLSAASAEVHAYAIEWDADQIRWYIDGFHVHTVNTLNTWGYTMEGDNLLIDNNAPFNQALELFIELSNNSADTQHSVVVDYVKTWTCDSSVDSKVKNCASGVKASLTKAASDRIETLEAVSNEFFADGYFDNNDLKVSDLTPVEWHYTDEIVEAGITNWNGPSIEILEEEGEHDLVIDVSHPEGDANITLTLPGVQIIGHDTTLNFDMYIDLSLIHI